MSRLEINHLRFLDRGPFALEIDAGECVSLSGASGAGKSLLLRSIADLDVHEGSVRLDGTEAADVEAPEWRKRVGLLLADGQWWHERVEQHFVSLPDAERLSSLGFERDVLEWGVARLSTGEKQRLALLRLLMNRPSALLLDEPTSGLDAVHQEMVERLVAEYRFENDAPVLWVSHDKEQARRVATRHYEMRENELVPLRGLA
jgi:ABC-type iron transport system FetAB ATPase subunit